MKFFCSRTFVFSTLAFLAACAAPKNNSSVSEEAYDVTKDLWLALGKSNGTKQDVYLAGRADTENMAICVLKSGQTDAEGLCIPAEKEGRFFKAPDIEINEQITIKITSLDAAGAEKTRKVKFKVAGSNGGGSLAPISDTMNISLKSPKGEDKKLSDVFEKEYLLVEFSAYDCGPCRSFATSFNKNASKYQKYFEDGKCSKVVIVGDAGGLKGRHSQWVSMLGADSWLGKASYGVSTSLGQASTKLGYKSSFSIPTLILVDRAGKVLDAANGLPDKVAQLCSK